MLTYFAPGYNSSESIIGAANILLVLLERSWMLVVILGVHIYEAVMITAGCDDGGCSVSSRFSVDEILDCNSQSYIVC